MSDSGECLPLLQGNAPPLYCLLFHLQNERCVRGQVDETALVLPCAIRVSIKPQPQVQLALWSEIEIVPDVDSMPLCSAAFRSATKRIPHRCSRRRFKWKATDAPSVAGTTGALRQRSPQARCLERMNPPRRSEALISCICHCPCKLSGLLLYSFQALLNRSPWVELLS